MTGAKYSNFFDAFIIKNISLKKINIKGSIFLNTMNSAK
jgi:hypothetical protein